MELEKNGLLVNFDYPQEFLSIVERQLIDLNPWSILVGEHLLDKFHGIKKRYPNNDVVPFARRWDNDDVACFNLADNKNIIIIHDYGDSNWTNRPVFDSFWDWFRKAIEDLIEFESL
jgi:hypothetical protein